MTSFGRYLQAFWGALRMTVRGEKVPAAAPPSPLLLWTRDYAQLVKAVLQAADANGLDAAARKQTKLRLDGRQMSLETVLLTLQFHATEEYTSLIGQGISQRVLNTVYATNMNDHYWVISMTALPEMQHPALQTALKTLEAHLDGVPKMDSSPQ